MSSKEAEDLCLSHRALLTIPQRQMISSSSWRRQQTVNYPQLRGPRRTVAGATPWPASCVAPQHSCIPSISTGPFNNSLPSNAAHGNSRPSHPLPFRLCSGSWGPTLPQGQEQSFGWEGRGVLGALGYCFPSFEPRRCLETAFKNQSSGSLSTWSLSRRAGWVPRGAQHPAVWLAALCQGPTHLVGLPRPMGCLQGLVQPLRHQHQEASHPVQGLCTVDFGLCDDWLGLGSAGGRE